MYRPPKENAMTCDEIIEHLKSLADPDNLAGMARYGISVASALGVSVPALPWFIL